MALSEAPKGVLLRIQIQGLKPSLHGLKFHDKANNPEALRIALTANVMPEQQQSYIEAGMDGVIPKPINAAQLLNALEAVLRAGQRVRVNGRGAVGFG